MVSMLQNVAIDCANAYEQARFWSGVTGFPLHGPGFFDHFGEQDVWRGAHQDVRGPTPGPNAR